MLVQLLLINISKVFNNATTFLDLQFGGSLCDDLDEEFDGETVIAPTYPGSTSNRDLYFEFEP